MGKDFIKWEVGDIVEENRLDIHDRQSTYNLLILESPSPYNDEHSVLVLDTGQVVTMRFYENAYRTFKKLA